MSFLGRATCIGEKVRRNVLGLSTLNVERLTQVKYRMLCCTLKVVCIFELLMRESNSFMSLLGLALISYLSVPVKGYLTDFTAAAFVWLMLQTEALLLHSSLSNYPLQPTRIHHTYQLPRARHFLESNSSQEFLYKVIKLSTSIH